MDILQSTARFPGENNRVSGPVGFCMHGLLLKLLIGLCCKNKTRNLDRVFSKYINLIQVLTYFCTNY